MTPTVTLLIGVVLIWAVSNGRAKAIWEAFTGSAIPKPGGQTKPPDPSSGIPNIPPGSGQNRPPNQA